MKESNKQPIRILLLDDEEDLVEFLTIRLEKRGFRVTATTSGPDALAVCKKQKFDVAILDLKMPQMDGIEALRHCAPMSTGCDVRLFVESRGRCRTGWGATGGRSCFGGAGSRCAG